MSLINSGLHLKAGAKIDLHLCDGILTDANTTISPTEIGYLHNLPGQITTNFASLHDNNTFQATTLFNGQAQFLNQTDFNGSTNNFNNSLFIKDNVTFTVNPTRANPTISFGNQILQNVKDPVNLQDATTKNYVDTANLLQPFLALSNTFSGTSNTFISSHS